MIQTERIQIDGRSFIRTSSGAGRYVVRDGVSYSEACDPEEFGRTYTEGDVMPVDDTEAAEILNIILGGDGE